VYGEAAVHAGIAKLALNANVGRNEHSYGSSEYRDIKPKDSFKDGIGMKASVSGGGQLTLTGGGTPSGGCSC
jgi:hypothetical protein